MSSVFHLTLLRLPELLDLLLCFLLLLLNIGRSQGHAFATPLLALSMLLDFSSSSLAEASAKPGEWRSGRAADWNFPPVCSLTIREEFHAKE